MNKNKAINRQRQRRRNHVRNKLRGTPDRPRLSVFRSHKHVYCQLIDDSTGRTLIAASTRDKDLEGQNNYGGNKAAAEAVGKAVAQRALQAGIKAARFDRGQNKYHGRLAALAQAAREVGLSL